MHKKYYLPLLFILFSFQVSAQSIYYVRSDGNDGNAGNSNTSAGAKATLSAAVSAASAGDIIQIGPGSFSGSGFSGINLGTKYLKIIGSGNGSNPVTSTVISGAGSGSTFLTMAKGASSTNRMEVWNLYISAFSFFFDQVDSNSFFYNLSIVGDSSYLQQVWKNADQASGIEIEKCNISKVWSWTAKYISGESGHVFRSDNGKNLYNVSFRNCVFAEDFIGVYLSQGSAPSSKVNADNIVFFNCSFKDMGNKVFYGERIDNLTIENCSFNNVGKTTYGHPAAIDINLKWNAYSGAIQIKNCYFNACAIPNSGTDVNGAAILFKSRDFGSYAGTPASFSGTLSINGCIFKNNNAGIRFGESNNGSGTGSGENASYGSGTIEIRNCIIQSNTGGSYQTYNHFGVRNVTTRNINVVNCYLGGGAAGTNTAFSGPVDVSTPNSSGSSTISGTLTTGEFIRLNSSDTYQGNYSSFANALAASSDGDKIIIPPSTVSGSTSVGANLTFISPGAGSLYSSHKTTFQNLTVTGSKTLTFESDFAISGTLSVTSGNGLTLGKYFTLELAGGITSGGTFTGGVVSSAPKSELLLSGTGNITIPAFVNGLAVLNVTRTASDIVSLGANLSITNVNFSNATINLNGFKLTVNGVTLVNTSTIGGSTTGSELEIAGTSRTFQLNGGTFANLNINRNQGTQLNGDVTVTNTLILSNGSLFLGSFNCTLESTATINGTPSASKMIIAAGTGQLRKKFTSSGSFTFPVGDDIGTFEFSPITLNFTSGTFGSGALAGVNLSDVKHPSNTSTTDFLTRYWAVTQSNISSFSCTVSSTYLDADINGTETNLVGGKFLSGSWINLGSVTAASNLITGTVTGFSDFTAGESSALPVTWLNVSAKRLPGGSVDINWVTSSEINNDYFEIQRSVNGVNFETIGNEQANGTTNSVSAYLFTDNTIKTQWPVLFYRIKQVDYNGNFDYSAIVSVQQQRNEKINQDFVYPNPFSDNITVQLSSETKLQSFALIDMKGNEWHVNISSDGDNRFQLSGLGYLPSGVYLFRLITGDGLQQVKLVK